ncbi:MAG: hypothetical protein H5T86_11195, partial [Armatimonadetes bacterium]|nr:hypothetical protein [Armatimonadota bacterium]
GISRGWHRGDEQLSRRIRVPFPWQSHAAWGTEDQAGNDNWFSKEAFINPEEVCAAERSYSSYCNAPQFETGWYRRQIEVPQQWLAEGKRVFVNIGAADWHVDVWVNGHKVGSADSGYLPVSFDITDHLREGPDLLVIRVHDPMEHSAQPVGKQYNWYTRTSGIWQSVWLEPRTATHIASARILPDRRSGVIRVIAKVAAGEDALRARASLQVSLGGQAIAAAHKFLGDLSAAQGSFEIAVRVPSVRQWSPESPVLYDLSLTLEYNRADGSRAKDEVNMYCGFRDVTVQPLCHGGPKYICINGEPVYLRGALNQSFNPWGVYTFPSDEDIRRDIRQAKEAGFNFVRLHIKIEDPRWYYWCDREGLLVMQDMPNFGYDGWCDEALERWEQTLRGAIERDFNHPCIIAWCLFNETWGLGGEEYKKLRARQRWVADMYYLAKRLDPTRPVEDNSICLRDHVITDINSWHFYINDYAAAADHIAKVVDATYPGSRHHYVPGRFQRDEPLMNSEYGGISALMGDKDVSWCFRFLTNELRYHEKICGYVYTEQMDIEWEHNGFYNYDRTPKQFGYNPRLLQMEQFVGISGPAGREAEAGEAVALRWWLRGPAPQRSPKLIVRAHHWNCLAEMDGHWTRTIEISDWAMATLEEHELPLPEELTATPGLVWVWFELISAENAVIAGNWAVVEVTGDPLLPEGAEIIDLSAPASCGGDGDVEMGQVDGNVHLLAAPGRAHFEFALRPPRYARGLTILAELSSCRPGPDIPQTDADAWPTEISVKLAGEEVARCAIGNQYADAAGALSHMHGFAGRYGEPVRIELAAEDFGKALARAPAGEMMLRFEVPKDASNAGGIAIYGPRAGRYPCGLTVLWHLP